ncbi:hypothetical protein VIGAN_04342900 [Vigna angularis var. angularis]|uniref:Uncharacterized protein n=1 Tax=Vigna angularis var. angularis TaxID=157739 RepID=A0A0S3RZ16_PHAAN|nr:hypothetical protein VIGAN_04342900 [Vigna angularis var. angularis]
MTTTIFPFSLPTLLSSTPVIISKTSGTPAHPFPLRFHLTTNFIIFFHNISNNNIPHSPQTPTATRNGHPPYSHTANIITFISNTPHGHISSSLYHFMAAP